MKIFKKGILLAVLFILAFVQTALCFEVKDVKSDFWAAKEIQGVLNDSIMELDTSGLFHPAAGVTRVDFVNMLLKVLGQPKNIDLSLNYFKDVNDTTKGLDDIAASSDMGLVYGYPDGTFKPKNRVIKSEVTSVMSHITKDVISDLSVLEGFADVDKIPAWAKDAYAKTVNYDLYVNYPDAKKFEPQREITRAEVAVLLYKLKNKLDLLKDKYLTEKTLSIEHLNAHPQALVNTVTVTNMRKIIAEGNIIPVEFYESYKSKNSQTGERVSFVVNEDIFSKEGTLIIPTGTKLYADVDTIVEPKWFNKNARVRLKFSQIEPPNGKVADIDGQIFTKDKDGFLKEGPWETAGKLGAYTVGGLALGAGAGVAAGVPTDKLGNGLAIGIPIGATVGLVTGLVTKGLNYTAKPGEKVYVKFLSNVSVWDNL